jgi:hypothetical protein
MGGVYSLNPQGFDLRKADVAKKFYPGIDGNFPNGIPGSEGDPFYLRPAGFWDGGDDWESYEISDGSQDYLLEDPTGKSTSGLIADDGSVKAALPPNSRHFILGPLVDGYVPNHGYDNFTNIGYLQKDTRQFVLLARIQGQFTADLHSEGARVWDGTEGQLTIINSNFTLEMAEWFRDQIIAGSFTPNVPYFYSGGVPQQPQTPATCPNCPPNMFGGVGPGTTRQFGTGKPPTLGTQFTNPPPDSGNQLKANIFNLTPDQQQVVMNALMLGLDIAAVIAFLFPDPASTAAGAAHLASKFRYAAKVGQALNKFNPFKTAARAKSWWNRGRNTRIPNENKASWKQLRTDDRQQIGRFVNPKNPTNPDGSPRLTGGALPNPTKGYQMKQFFTGRGGATRSFNPFLGPGKGLRSGPTPLARQQIERPARAIGRAVRGAGKKFRKEEFDLYQTLLETAPTGSGLAGGTEVADAYVDTVSQDASPDQLEQAANDANDIATQGGQGLSDSDLEQIDNQAEQDARELYKRMDNPNSMSTEQIRSAVTEIYNSNSEWLYGAFDQYESLVPDDAEFERIEQEHENKKIELQTNIDNIKLEIKEIDDQYSGGAYGSFNYKGVRVRTDKNWGSQFTPQNFESSGQSWEDYSALRVKLGFLNGNSGPTEYGRYLPIGWSAILNAKENGHTSANFSGIAKEIVAKGEELDEITSNPNFPQPGRNIYYTEADYLEAVELQDKAAKVFAEYKNLWEGPGGYDDIYDQMWEYDNRSREMQTELAYAAALRKQELERELENIDTEISDDALYEQYDALMKPFYVAIIKDWNTFVNLFNVMTADAYDNYNWLWKNYGLPAAEWYIKNQKKPMKSNPFIPKGAYLPLALENPLETDPFSLEGLTPTSISSMSEAEKKKLIQQLIAQGLINPDGSIKAHAVSDDVTSDMIRGLEKMIKDAGPMAPMPIEQQPGGGNMPTPPAEDLLDPDKAEDYIAANPKMPDYVKDSIRRQYKGGPDYTIEDKKNIINWQKKMKASGSGTEVAANQGPSTPVKQYDGKFMPNPGGGRVKPGSIRLKGKAKMMAHYEPPKFIQNREREQLSETRTPNQRRILREIRQPVEIKKAPSKYKINFTNKNTFSSQTDELVSKANVRGQQWRDENKRWSGYETTEKDNIIQDRVGHGKQAFDYMIEQGTQKSEWRTKEVQEELNKIAHEKAMLKENPDFKSPFGNVEVTTTEKNIKNFEKVNRIKKVVVDKKVFSNKEIKPEYPEDDKMSKAYSMPDVLDQEKSPFGKGEVQNPEFGKIEFEHEKLKSGERASAYYKKLDPISAKSMPDAAYPQIDDLKNQARKKPK